MRTDAELLRAYGREGSQAAFAELVQRHLALVYGAALRHVGGDAHLAEDVSQIVFTALARKARQLDGRGALAGWLYLGAHHAAAQVVRAERRRRAREEAHAMDEQLTGEAGGAEWQRVRPVLDEALRALGETDREAVLLRFFEQRAFGQVGAALNVSEDAARMRVERALEKLRGQLARRGVTSTAAALGIALAQQPAIAVPAGLAAQVAGAALAAAGAKAGGGMWFMNTTMMTVGAVAVIAIGGMIQAGYRASEAEAAVAVALQERDLARSQAQAADVAARKASEAEARARTMASTRAPTEGAAREAAATLAVALAERPPTKESRVAGWSFVSADGTAKGTHYYDNTPEGRRKSVRDAVGQTFGAFFRKLGWSVQQQELFKDLWADHKEAVQQKLDTAKAEGRTIDREFLKAAVNEAAREHDAKLVAAFGPGIVEAKRDFEAKRPFRHATEQLAQRLFYTDTPLAQTQAEALIDAMANQARRPGGGFDIRAMNFEAALTQAQGVLSPPQAAVWRAVEEERRRQQELEQRMLAERSSREREAPKPAR